MRGRLQRVAEGCRVAQMRLNPIRQGILLHPAGSRSGCSEITIFTICRFAGWMLFDRPEGHCASVPRAVWRLRLWYQNRRVIVSGGFRM